MAFFKPLLFIVLVVFAVCASEVNSRTTHHHGLSMIKKHHEQWMAKHGRVYKNEMEREMRFKIFAENYKHIESANNKAGNSSYKLGLNSYADLTDEEFQSYAFGYLTPKVSPSSRNFRRFRYRNATDLPESVDWRQKGAVTHIKNQGRCGSCWAFAMVAMVEGMHQINKGELVSLSEQHLLDCTEGCYGCGGGYYYETYMYIERNGGIAKEEDYSYEGYEDYCQARYIKPYVKIGGFETVPRNEHALMQAVANQPVGVSIDGSGFRYYSEGIFDGPCCKYHSNHAVVIVGYGTSEDGIPYWLVKNSWGTRWGEDGYVRMKRGVNICGINNDASYPTPPRD
ncbi:hypothetical protein M9H77_24314 [Catharanthus roseus]|uniref:Uncharacterized protein n=1 Tax=Catharanthus roseus TaxID=4058 RepID=A0ACC0AW51_CATRO|nr:hypothetical protein M9H77_24314 [Catharanthus roseus]